MQFLQKRKNKINGLMLVAAGTLVGCSAGGNTSQAMNTRRTCTSQRRTKHIRRQEI